MAARVGGWLVASVGILFFGTGLAYHFRGQPVEAVDGAVTGAFILFVGCLILRNEERRRSGPSGPGRP